MVCNVAFPCGFVGSNNILISAFSASSFGSGKSRVHIAQGTGGLGKSFAPRSDRTEMKERESVTSDSLFIFFVYLSLCSLLFTLVTFTLYSLSPTHFGTARNARSPVLISSYHIRLS